MSVQYDRARSSSPAGVRSAPVVDVGRASLGSSYGKVDALLGRWMWQATPRLSEELRVQYGRDFQYEQAQAPLPQEPAVGPGGFAPEIAIGPNGFTFGSSPSLGRKSFPDENKVQLADMVTWTRGRHQLQTGVDVSFVHDAIRFSDEYGGCVSLRQLDDVGACGRAGGLDYGLHVQCECLSEWRVPVDCFEGA